MRKILKESSLLNVGIIGIDKGEGATSLAVGMASYLQEVRCKRVALAEMNRSGEFYEIRNTYFGTDYREIPFEIFRVDYYPGMTKERYAQVCNMGYDCIVTDFGSVYQRAMEDFLRCDRKIVVGSVNLWKYGKYLEFHEYTKNFPGVGNWLFLLSGDEDDIRMIKTKHNIRVMNKEFYMNPYSVSEEEAVYYETILEGI